MNIGNGLFYRVFLLFSLAVISCAHAGEGDQVTMESQSDPLITISTGDSIQIEMKNTPLHDALSAVTQQSKIHFEVPESLLKDKITLSHNCKDWPEAIKRMLKNYNIAYGWEKNELKTVFIFERGTGKVLQLIPTPENELPQLNATESNQQANDALPDETVIPSLPSIPTDEEKITEIKRGTRKPGKREKKTEMENKEDILQVLPPELPPDLSGEESENGSGILLPDEPALLNVK